MYRHSAYYLSPTVSEKFMITCVVRNVLYYTVGRNVVCECTIICTTGWGDKQTPPTVCVDVKELSLISRGA